MRSKRAEHSSSAQCGAAAAAGRCRLCLTVMERGILYCTSSRTTFTRVLCLQVGPKQALIHRYALHTSPLFARRFLSGSSSFPSNAATKIAASPVTEWDVGRKEEEKKEERFLLRNPKPDWDFAIRRKRLAKGRTGLCQTKQTADRVQGKQNLPQESFGSR